MARAKNLKPPRYRRTMSFIACSPDGTVRIMYLLKDETFGAGCCSAKTFRTVVPAYVNWFDSQVRARFFPINPFDLNEKVPENGSSER